ncbi:nickel ABC transporter permease [Staphylococcus agnetis]|uniref:nickel ABC transporter permease n=1 Tax=Staphylococcus agnetis TaxID=985762 RepID=UPI000D1B6CF0|nr:nickel ABC transporter permease [Staphylococcus agnetis]PTH56273.1 peptide ABC transporter permease [Staphylococcus agnetis]
MINKLLRHHLIHMVLILWVLSTITFILMKITPGDPISQQLYAHDVHVSQAQLDHMQRAHGLNQPFLLQYLSWLGHIVRFDFGRSYQTGADVMSAILQYAPPTILLALLTIFVVLCISLPLGIAAAWHHQRTLDYTIRIGTSIAVSVPSFFLAILLLYVFAVRLQWLPIAGFSSPLHLILPVTALSVSMCAYYVRLIRITLLSLYQSREVEMVRFKGVSEWFILVHVVLKPTLIPVITMLALSMGSLIGGTVVVENIFGIPGLGQFLMESIRARDYPVIQGIVLFLGVVVVFSNTAGDYVVSKLDPKRRQSHVKTSKHHIDVMHKEGM